MASRPIETAVQEPHHHPHHSSATPVFVAPSNTDQNPKTPQGDSGKQEAVNQLRGQIMATEILYAYNLHENTIDALTKMFEGESLSSRDVKSMSAKLQYVKDSRYRDDSEYDVTTPDSKKRSMRRSRRNPRNSRFTTEM